MRGLNGHLRRHGWQWLLAAGICALACPVQSDTPPQPLYRIDFEWPEKRAIHQDIPQLLKVLRGVLPFPPEYGLPPDLSASLAGLKDSGPRLGEPCPDQDILEQAGTVLSAVLRTFKCAVYDDGNAGPKVTMTHEKGVLTVRVAKLATSMWVPIEGIAVQAFTKLLGVPAGQKRGQGLPTQDTAYWVRERLEENSEGDAALLDDILTMRDLSKSATHAGAPLGLKRVEYLYHPDTKTLTIYASQREIVGAAVLEYDGPPARPQSFAVRLARDLGIASQLVAWDYGRLASGRAKAKRNIGDQFERVYLTRGFPAVNVSTDIEDGPGQTYGLARIRIAEGPFIGKPHALTAKVEGDSASGRMTGGVSYEDTNFRRRNELLGVEWTAGGREGWGLSLSAKQDAYHARNWSLVADRWTTPGVTVGDDTFDETKTRASVSTPLDPRAKGLKKGIRYEWSREELDPVGAAKPYKATVGVLGASLRHDPHMYFIVPPPTARRSGQGANAGGDGLRASRAQLDIDLGSQVLGGDDTFVKAQADVRTHWRLGGRAAVAVRLGTAWCSHDTPVTEHFELGGDQLAGLLRAHEPQDFRGRRVVLANLEFRRSLRPEVDAVAFIDVGKVTDGPNPTDGVETDVGIGLRYFGLGSEYPLSLFVAHGEGRSRFGFAVSRGY